MLRSHIDWEANGDEGIVIVSGILILDSSSVGLTDEGSIPTKFCAASLFEAKNKLLPSERLHPWLLLKVDYETVIRKAGTFKIDVRSKCQCTDNTCIASEACLHTGERGNSS